MSKVVFELSTPDGHFTTQDTDGKAVRLKAGETYTTGDPFVIRELDNQKGVRRVKPEEKKDKD